MKFTRTLQIVSMLILGIGQASGALQIYYYSGPVSGYTEVALTPGGHGDGEYRAYFGTLSETLYYDPAAQTLEEVGTVAVNPSSGTFDIQALSVGVVGSATLTVGIDGSFSFDHTSVFNPSSGSGPSELPVPVSGSGIYNGQAFSGSWNIDLNLNTQIIAVTPTSLTFTESRLDYSHGMNVIPGTDLYDAIEDTLIYTDWQLSGVAIVPEDRNYSLYYAIGALVLAFFSSMRKRTAKNLCAARG